MWKALETKLSLKQQEKKATRRDKNEKSKFVKEAISGMIKKREVCLWNIWLIAIRTRLGNQPRCRHCGNKFFTFVNKWMNEWHGEGETGLESYSLFKNSFEKLPRSNLCLPSEIWRFMVTLDSFYCKFPNSNHKQQKNLRSMFEALNTYNYIHFQFSQSTSTQASEKRNNLKCPSNSSTSWLFITEIVFVSFFFPTAMIILLWLFSV